MMQVLVVALRGTALFFGAFQVVLASKFVVKS